MFGSVYSIHTVRNYSIKNIYLVKINRGDWLRMYILQHFIQ